MNYTGLLSYQSPEEIKEKAIKLLEHVENKVRKSRSFFNRLFGHTIDFEEAAEIVTRAANLFKYIEMWKSSGDAFVRSAQLLLYNNQYSMNAASNFVNASKVFKRIDNYEAINCMYNAIDIYVNKGNFYTAAKCYMDIAEIYDKDLFETDKAIEHYEKASDYYRGDGNNKLSGDCTLRAAMLYVQREEFMKAATMYEQVGYDRVDTELLRYGVKKQFFYAVICNLCVDIINAKSALDKYKSAYPVFKDFIECKLIEKLLDAYDNEDVDAFTEAIREHDNVSKIEDVMVTMLLRIKKSITENKSLC
ncbi:SWPV1-016 [Shearwaterpox virus]|uniref:SWPV1-016 n=1 Tax=Shearwaterpox virus TaxID=1974596 RepID=A0A1V0S7M7_CNPV|nr:SWPV1-016 [Shearwaterpox virus]